MTPELAGKLREPFKPEEIGKLPRVSCWDCKNSPSKNCAKHKKIKCPQCKNFISSEHIHLDYVGHAEITDRLLQVDTSWTWEPVAFTDAGTPHLDAMGGLWIRLTVAGVQRLGYGHADGKKGADAVKEAIGDALRNAAMRFGVGLDLWGAKFDEPAEERPEEPPGPVLVSEYQIRELMKLLKTAEMGSREVAMAYVNEAIAPEHVETLKNLTADEASVLMGKLNRYISQMAPVPVGEVVL